LKGGFTLTVLNGEYSRILGFDADFLMEIAIQWINVIFIVVILSWLLHKPVSKFLNDRNQRIQNDIQTAATNLEEANKQKATYETKLAGIDVEREGILEDARKLAAAREAEILEAARAEAKLYTERSRLEIQRERDSAQDEMKRQIIQVSALMAERLLDEAISDADKERVLNKAIAELGDATWKI